MANKPRFTTTDIRTQIARVDRKPSYYPTYRFTGRTFVKQDVPGRRPS